MESIESIIPKLSAALADTGTAVLSAPPGSGKTTIVPLALAKQTWLDGRKIIILEPRRLAARLAARRMAENLGEEVGETVGLLIRFEKRTGPNTKIIVATEGVLTRILQDDPELPGCGLVIFDEFHERSLEADLGLAFTLDVKKNLRPDLGVLIMSATLDCAGISAFLDNCPIIRGGSRSYPVETIYLDLHGDAADFNHFDFHRLCRLAAAAIQRVLAGEEGDILVFLPGTGEIRKVTELIAPKLAAGEVLRPLYGDLSRAAQDRAILPDPENRRIILATAVAETSITIEGISIVIDSGFARRPRFDPGRGMTRLETVRVTRAEATQRSGRAGRVAPGRCYRLWPGNCHTSLLAAPAPESRNADLSPLVLELKRWGVSSAAELQWLDPPPPSAFNHALALLQRLGFIDNHGLSGMGRRAARIPAHPRLAAMIIAGEKLGCPALACDLAAIISERDPLGGPESPADLELRLDLIQGRKKPAAGTVKNIIRTAALLGRGVTAEDKKGREMAAVIIAAGYPDRVARQRQGSRDNYRLASGAGARLRQHDPLGKNEFLVIAGLGRGQSRIPRINLAIAADIEELRQYLPHLFRVEEKVFWAQKSGRVKAVSRRICGLLVCGESRLPPPDPETAFKVMEEGISKAGEIPFSFSAAARGLQERIAAARRFDPGGGWPEVDDKALMVSIGQWLPAWIGNNISLAAIKKIDMAAVIAFIIGPARQQQLNHDLPETITTPGGSRIKIKYPVNGPPVMAVRLQEMFSCKKTPAVMNGRVGLLLHLLNPAMRPVQVTGDLESFWNNGYKEVKKQLAGRYPKHPWPDDPAAAQPWRPGKGRRQKT